MEFREKQTKQIRSILLVASTLVFIASTFGSLSKELGGHFLEIAHQYIVGLGVFILVLGLRLSLKHIRKHVLPISLIIVATFLVGFQTLIGQVLYRIQTPFWVSGTHYVLSVFVLGFVGSATTYLFLVKYDETPQIKFSSSFSKQAVLSVVMGIFILISGVYVSMSGIRGACVNWPLCEGGMLPLSLDAWIVFIHRILVAIVGLYLLWFNNQAWQKQRTQRIILTASNLFVVLFFAQGFVGALKTIQNFPVYMLILHEVTAVFLVTIGFILLISIGVISRQEEDEIQEKMLPINRKQRMKDLLALNKPIVVLLLLSTTVAGMVIGAGRLPDLDILIVTVIGGFLAAGGSSAINQFIDRDLDRLMTRTANRPIPSGRLTPAEGLAFGVTALVISFYLLAGFVNILAAVLALGGMIYYIFLYSLYLKKRSVQNIVIGGGAGAIPPLVGWAAATGSLNLTASFLFFIIFLWTPPHFWALALLRKNEYAAAGIPMMPVEKGDETTKKLIYQYSIVLVISTLVMWLLGLAGWIFLGGAIILGTYLLILARQVLVNGRNRIYYRMYRHSNYYLLFLFVILAVDSMMR